VITVDADGGVSLVDNSSCGTVVGDQAAARNQVVAVAAGLRVRFGQMSSSFVLVGEPPVVLGFCNQGKTEEGVRFKALADKIGARTLEKWSAAASHWVVGGAGKITITLLQALVGNTPIVTLAWLDEVVKTHRLVAAEQYQPSLDALAERLERATHSQVAVAPDYRPNPHRRTLFKGLTVVLSNDAALAKEAEVLRMAGATVASVKTGLPAQARNVSVLVASSKDVVPAEFADFALWTRADLVSCIVGCTLLPGLTDTHAAAAAAATTLQTPVPSHRAALPPSTEPMLPASDVKPAARRAKTSPALQPPVFASPSGVEPASAKAVMSPAVAPARRADANMAAASPPPPPPPAEATTTPQPAPRSAASVVRRAAWQSQPAGWIARRAPVVVHDDSGQRAVCETVPLVVASTTARPATNGGTAREREPRTAQPPNATNTATNFKKFRKNKIERAGRPPVKEVDVYSVTAPQALQEAFRQMEEDEMAAMRAFDDVKAKRSKAFAATAKRTATSSRVAAGAAAKKRKAAASSSSSSAASSDE